jgi:D-alanine-D-alanine ligase-like ATP-grasp enzyme
VQGQYELIGCDILIDSDLKPYLIELNTNPALHLSTTVQAKVISEVVEKTIRTVLAINKFTDNKENRENYIRKK